MTLWLGNGLCFSLISPPAVRTLPGFTSLVSARVGPASGRVGVPTCQAEPAAGKRDDRSPFGAGQGPRWPRPEDRPAAGQTLFLWFLPPGLTKNLIVTEAVKMPNFNLIKATLFWSWQSQREFTTRPDNGRPEQPEVCQGP